jgi:phenylpropionate dioxygenase-like ring-hydroxylating dioxygenase large terminal subunit
VTYLRNAWYGVGFAADIARIPKPITVLDETLVLFRRLDGRAFALGDRCPHHFAPLHLGKLQSDAIECPYHGLQFDCTGACVLNPHSEGAIPQAARVAAYPLVERYGFVWVWMGDIDRADASQIPDFSVFDDHEHFATVRGYMRIEANYQLAVDNLLDLSHSEYLHPRLANATQYRRAKHAVIQEGTAVWSKYDFSNEVLSEISKSMWDDPTSDRADTHAYMRWNPPCTQLVESGTTGVGRPQSEGVLRPTALLLARESERVTHYFWMSARNRGIHDAELGERVRRTVDDAFSNQDKPIIEAQQRNMNDTPFGMLRPVLLKTDRAATQVRRSIEKLIATEQSLVRPNVAASPTEVDA